MAHAQLEVLTMYKLVTIEDTVAIPPTRMMEDVKKVCWEIVLENLSKKP